MGGVGSGGPRARAGRPWECGYCLKKNAPVLDSCEGCGRARGTKPGRLLAHPSVPVPPAPPIADLDESQAPNDLSVDERLIWMELGALALSKGKSLAMIRAYPFRLLCTNVALERRYAKSVTEAGSANHRGMIQAIDREMLRFGLVDFGKETPKVKPVVNSFAAAFGASK